MAKKADEKVAKSIPNRREGKGKIFIDELYFRHVDQGERWRQEYEHYQLLEKKLLEFNTLTYEEFDYAPQLVRAIFKERIIPDFSYLLEEARIAAEAKFFMPMIAHLVAVAVLVVVLIASTNTIVLWGSGAGVLIVIILLALLLENRSRYIARTLLEKQEEIKKRIAYEQKKIAEEKKQHDDSEDQRIQIIEQLLAGQVTSILDKIESVLHGRSIPFYLEIEIELYNDTPGVKVWLPDKSLIPTQTCALTAAGRLNFDDKTVRVINRQYLELCAALIVRVMSVIYCYIPTFNIGYVYGLSQGKQNVECLIASKLDRETLIQACSASNVLAALQSIQAKFECNPAAAMMPIDFKPPEEWGDEPEVVVRKLHLLPSKEGRNSK